MEAIFKKYDLEKNNHLTYGQCKKLVDDIEGKKKNKISRE
jgi:hypothetical protein